MAPERKGGWERTFTKSLICCARGEGVASKKTNCPQYLWLRAQTTRSGHMKIQASSDTEQGCIISVTVATICSCQNTIHSGQIKIANHPDNPRHSAWFMWHLRCSRKLHGHTPSHPLIKLRVVLNIARRAIFGRRFQRKAQSKHKTWQAGQTRQAGRPGQDIRRQDAIEHCMAWQG